MTNLKHLSFICSILVLATISIPLGQCRVLQPNDIKLIDDTCNHTPDPNLCIHLLQSDPRSSNATDVNDLALIMVDILKFKATYTLNKIHQLLQGGGDKGALTSCASKYKTILEADIPQATQALQLGNPKFAEDGASDSSVEATACEESFSAGKSPLTNENNDMNHAAEVTRAIIRLLL